MKFILIVGFGGFLGSVCRYTMNLMFLRFFPLTFPVGTLAINIIGSLLLGVVYGVAEQNKVISDELRIFLAVGFCGSFTTFSTFAMEGLQLLNQRGLFLFTIYIVASVTFGILCFAAGYILTRQLY